MPSVRLDITGNVYGLLRVHSMIYVKGERSRALTLCRCGGILETRAAHLVSKNIVSCGNCRPRERFPAEYVAWANMLARCRDPNNPRYKNYGGRGITVCSSWAISFWDFFEDMGSRTEDFLSLDRIDNNLGYSKDNCRWTNSFEQNNNRSI